MSEPEQTLTEGGGMEVGCHMTMFYSQTDTISKRKNTKPSTRATIFMS